MSDRRALAAVAAAAGAATTEWTVTDVRKFYTCIDPYIAAVRLRALRRRVGRALTSPEEEHVE